MGSYLNPGASGYRTTVRSPVFVDKTEMLRHLNSVTCTGNKYVCVTRPRRFGKTVAAKMVCAYYGRGDGGRELFEGLEISKTDPVAVGGEEIAWDHHLGAFDVVRVTVTDFIDAWTDVEEGLADLVEEVSAEIVEAYPGADYFDEADLSLTMADAYEHSGRQFVVVVDECDAPIRERAEDVQGQRAYLDFLRDWLKDQDYVALAYMTGILPIKKRGEFPLNMFDEHTMASPKALAEFVGFTDDEVRRICEAHGNDYESMREWYGGYLLSRGGGNRRETLEAYNPLAVACAADFDEYVGYWGRSNTYKALAAYIDMDLDGLKRKIAVMVRGGRVRADIGGFQNDMVTLSSADDVIALLVHLGYLGWDSEASEAFVPNRDVLEVFRRATKGAAWKRVFRELRRP